MKQWKGWSGLRWGSWLSLCLTQCVFISQCVPVIVARGCSKQLTWHCWGHPRESSCQPQPEATASKREQQGSKATGCINLSHTSYSKEKRLLNKTRWSEAKGNLSQAAISTLLHHKQIITQCSVCKGVEPRFNYLCVVLGFHFTSQLHFRTSYCEEHAASQRGILNIRITF